MRNVIIALDLGLDGAVVINHDPGNGSRQVISHRMPVIKGKKPTLDIAGLRDILKPWDGLVVYERIGQIFQSSKATAFSMGYQRGVIEALCVSMGFAYLDFPPKDWQKEMFTGTPEIKTKDDKRDTKAMAAAVAKRLNPTLVLNFPGMTKPVHDGLVDAYLIGEFVIRKNL